MNDSQNQTDARLIFACSGAADVGELSDAIMRRLKQQGSGSSYCLAGIAAHEKGMIERTRNADAVTVIDGCPVECARKTLERAGIERVDHFVLTSLGFAKGATEVNEKTIAEGSAKCQNA